MDNPYQSPQSPCAPALPRYRRAIVCPHCGGPAMSLLRKSLIDPLQRPACRSCRQTVGVAWRRSLFIGAAVVVTIVATLFLALVLSVRVWPAETSRIVGAATAVEATIAAVIVGVLGGLIFCVVQVWLSPLIKK
ncbi:MAG: hypothetical protein AAF589_03965 [Planctomycetota bacterium]